jgi:sulfate adenylyltransferase subunit 1 (EFTu-like GTPase family)
MFPERNLNQAIDRLTGELRNFMATVPAGLAALTKAVSDLTAGISAAVTELQTLSTQLTNLNSEDPAVQNLAAQIETQVGNLATAVAAVQPPATT